MEDNVAGQPKRATLEDVIQTLSQKVIGIEDKVFGEQPKVEGKEESTPSTSKLHTHIKSLERLAIRLNRINNELEMV